ncbi:hypothetical protein Lal_00018670 [Lupinus albus]|nr:hypothetical protein Lal_00018670 [Lupinus albus]
MLPSLTATIANQIQNQKEKHDDFSLKETTPNISAGRVTSGDRLPTAFDVIEKMHFLFAGVVKAKDLLHASDSDSDTCNPYVEMKL